MSGQLLFSDDALDTTPKGVGNKARLVVTATITDIGKADFDVCQRIGGHDYIDEDISSHLYLCPCLLLSQRQLRFQPGSKVRLTAVIEMRYLQDYWGEHDSELVVLKRRVRKVQTPTRKQQKKWTFDDRKYLGVL